MLAELNLPPLQDRRKANRLTFLYKVVEGLVPAMQSHDYLTPIRGKRLIKPKVYTDCVTSNIIDKQSTNNSKCFKTLQCTSEIYKYSFFPRTIIDWNHLDDNIFKKGEKYDAANYRPVSLTCICCKTLEHILVSNINKHLALDSILADCQHGFRSQRSCETQLVQFVHDIISNLDGAVNRGHKQTDLIIMDFAKAFDKVPHRRLLHKLDYYGIRGSTHKWINSWLSGRTQKVVLDGQASDPVPVLSGVPQGSVLGPILFLIFINDLPDNIRSSVRLFADDCVLYRNIHSIQDCFILQEDLTSLGQWEADWQMKFNVAKCHSMRVTRHQHHKQILFDYSLHNQTLENVQSAKYLGITISDNMDWGQHISEISSKATKTLGFLRRNLAFAPRSTKEVAYKTLVRPKLEYAAPIWSPYSKLQINQVEKVQRTAARWTCRRWRNTSSVGEMLDELEWPSLEARRDQSSLLLFHKIHSGAVSIEKDKYLTPFRLNQTGVNVVKWKILNIFC